MTAIVRTDSITKAHDGAAVLSNVDFALEEGEFLCIMGPSGSGKSTLLHLLSGLDDPTEGTVHLSGRNLASLAPRDRTVLRRDTVGHVFQFFNLLPNLSCRENIGLPLAIAGSDPRASSADIDRLLERFGLMHRADALPHQLSGGEMQRTSIARAIAGGQPLLLCDEPTGNLSQKAGEEVMQLLRGLRDDDGKTVLLVTHNPRDAAFADRVLFLVDGRLAEGVELTRGDNGVERIHETLAALSI